MENKILIFEQIKTHQGQHKLSFDVLLQLK